MAHQATGTFEVSMTPPASTGEREVALLGRMLLDKQYAGDLVATSQGHMLTAMTVVKGSAGYVAIELVTGTLGGRAGSFALQHSGTMHRCARGHQRSVDDSHGPGQAFLYAGLHFASVIRDRLDAINKIAA